MMEKPLCDCHGEPMYWNTSPRYKAGGYWYCAVKHRERCRRQYWEDPEKARAQAREYSRTYQLALRQQALDLLGNTCAECGSTEGPFDIDHVNGDGTEHRAQFGGDTPAYRHDLIRSIEAGEGRVQLLDISHRKKTWAETKAKVLA